MQPITPLHAVESAGAVVATGLAEVACKASCCDSDAQTNCSGDGEDRSRCCGDKIEKGANCYSTQKEKASCGRERGGCCADSDDGEEKISCCDKEGGCDSGKN